MPMTSHWRKKTGDHSIGKIDIGAVADVFLGIFLSDPGDAGLQASEVSGTGYARVNVTAKFGAFDATSGIAVNDLEISFGVPGSNWGVGAFVGILDAATAGNMRYREAVPNPLNMISGGRAVVFGAGRLKIQHI